MHLWRSILRVILQLGVTSYGENLVLGIRLLHFHCRLNVAIESYHCPNCWQETQLLLFVLLQIHWVDSFEETILWILEYVHSHEIICELKAWVFAQKLNENTNFFRCFQRFPRNEVSWCTSFSVINTEEIWGWLGVSNIWEHSVDRKTASKSWVCNFFSRFN